MDTVYKTSEEIRQEDEKSNQEFASLRGELAFALAGNPTEFTRGQDADKIAGHLLNCLHAQYLDVRRALSTRTVHKAVPSSGLYVDPIDQTWFVEMTPAEMSALRERITGSDFHEGPLRRIACALFDAFLENRPESPTMKMFARHPNRSEATE